ncbi:hypothetical protein [Burkholderia cenocepacia]|uniref:hypothetical protein n=1 Tax=Burkholderia cenocepacia TaxID=95486 RepID=UPI0011B1D323|nr:hypothetical protein [Burkholderia cenocepacia]HEM7884002.1 hypothetical protein [Burkholderia cenocepacia]
MERARRFRSFWEQTPDEDDQLKRQWLALERAARSPDHLLTLFLVMPDKAERNPFPLVTGVRKRGLHDISVAEERRRYSEVASQVHDIRTFLYSGAHRNFRNLLSDATATGGKAYEEAIKFRASSGDLRLALFHLEKLLELVDPAAKYPYGQPDGADAAIQAYVAVVAALNSHLSKPRHAALAYITRINNPRTPVTSDALRKAWDRSADKNAGK